MSENTRAIVYVAGDKGVYHNGSAWVWVQGAAVKPHISGARMLEAGEYVEIPRPDSPVMQRMADSAVVKMLMAARKAGMLA